MESSDFTNIEEVLGMFPTVDVERVVGKIIPMTGSSKPAGSIPSHTKNYYKKRQQVMKQNLCITTFHEELKKEGFYPTYLGKVKPLFGRPPLQQPP